MSYCRVVSTPRNSVARSAISEIIVLSRLSTYILGTSIVSPLTEIAPTYYAFWVRSMESASTLSLGVLLMDISTLDVVHIT